MPVKVPPRAADVAAPQVVAVRDALAAMHARQDAARRDLATAQNRAVAVFSRYQTLQDLVEAGVYLNEDEPVCAARAEADELVAAARQARQQLAQATAALPGLEHAVEVAEREARFDTQLAGLRAAGHALAATYDVAQADAAEALAEARVPRHPFEDGQEHYRRRARVSETQQRVLAIREAILTSHEGER